MVADEIIEFLANKNLITEYKGRGRDIEIETSHLNWEFEKWDRIRYKDDVLRFRIKVDKGRADVLKGKNGANFGKDTVSQFWKLMKQMAEKFNIKEPIPSKEKLLSNTTNLVGWGRSIESEKPEYIFPFDFRNLEGEEYVFELYWD